MRLVSINQPHFSIRVISFVILFVQSTALFSQNWQIIKLGEARKILNNSHFNNSKINIAIIDNGVLQNHPAFKENLWTNSADIIDGIDNDKNGYIDDYYGWNFANNTNDISNNGLGNWHGTPVNGIINSIVNWQVLGGDYNEQLINIVKGESIESIIQSLRYVYKMRKLYNQSDGSEGAFIVAVNCSWGKDSLWAGDYPEWCLLIDSLGNEGVLTVSSVPNENIDIDIVGDMPSNCTSDYLITVTNNNKYDQKVFDAAYGKIAVDIAAPGENSYTALNTGFYGYFGGTSAAAPYVSGVIGLLYLLNCENFINDIKENPGKTALLVKKAIFLGADKIASLENFTVSGARINAFNSLKYLCDYYQSNTFYENIFDKLHILSTYPNPVRNNLNLVVESDSEQQVNVIISDIYGHISVTLVYQLYKGIQSIVIDFGNYKPGVYNIAINSSRNQTSSTVIKY